MRHKPTDVILRARNGDVIAFDETGLILRLSDQVIRDIAARLDPAEVSATVPNTDSYPKLGVDAWNIRAEGDWLRFDACLPPFEHTRAYRRRIDGGAIVADAPCPVLGLFAVGGPSASDTYGARPFYPHHVMAPEDDLGAQGATGTETVRQSQGLQALSETTQGSHLADAVLAARRQAGRDLPLCVVRAETAGAHSVRALADGPALANLRTDFSSLSAIASSLAKQAEVPAVTLDLASVDVTGADAEFVTDTLHLIDEIDRISHEQRMRGPTYLLRVPNAPARLSAYWALAVHPAGRNIVVPCPTYAFESDRFGWLTEAGAAAIAKMDAAVLSELERGGDWRCPALLLAEREAGCDDVLKATFDAIAPLVIDAADPLGAGSAYGFDLTGPDGPVEIAEAAIDPTDKRALLIRSAEELPHGPLTLTYASDRPGALRDTWRHPEPGGSPHLRRWALPATCTVH